VARFLRHSVLSFVTQQSQILTDFRLQPPMDMLRHSLSIKLHFLIPVKIPLSTSPLLSDDIITDSSRESDQVLLQVIMSSDSWSDKSNNRFFRSSLKFASQTIVFTALHVMQSLLLLGKTITHPAARSLCDSWASCCRCRGHRTRTLYADG